MAESPAARPGRLSRLFRSTWLRWAAYSLLGLLVIEALLRAGDPSAGRGGSMPADPTLLWLPNDGDPREAAFTLDQSSGTGGRTAVFVGDSSVYGHGLSTNQSFPALVASEAPGRIRTLNLAAPGYSTFQSIRVLKVILPRERPELVVVANLWSDSNMDSFVDREQLAERDSLAFRIFFHTNRALSNFAIWRTLLKGLGQLRPLAVGWGKNLRQSFRDRRRVSIDEYAANLELISELARANGAEVLFLILANEEDLRDPEAIWPWHPYRRVMEESARRLGHPLLRLPDELRATGQSAEVLFMDEMHPSAPGHREIARIIARRLDQWGWLDGGALPGKATGEPRPTYLDPIVTRSHRALEGYADYSVTGIMRTFVDRQGAGSASSDKVRFLLEAVSVSDSATVLDSVTLPQAAAFVLTIDPPQPVVLRLRQGLLRQGTQTWGQPIWLEDGWIDLSKGPAWSLRIEAQFGIVISPAPLPEGWKFF